MPKSRPEINVSNDESADDLVVRMRQLGASLENEAIVETDVMNGTCRWANAFALSKTGHTAEEFAALSALEMIPEAFHSIASERMGGKRSKYYIVPLATSDGRACWWLAHDAAEQYPLHWSRGRYLLSTDLQGQQFELMRMMMSVTNLAGELLLTHEEVHSWVREEIQRLDANDAAIRRDLTQLSTKVGHAIAISKQAVDLGMANSKALGRVSETLDGLEMRVSVEIMRLIGQDAAYGKRMEQFETQLGVAAERATIRIEESATTAGRNIGKNVAKPVLGGGAFLVIMEYMLQHPEILGKIAMRFFG